MIVKENIKICMDITDEDISKELINILINLHEPIVSGRFKVLDNYYKGNQEILSRVIEDKDKPNNQPVTNFCSYITDVLTGFFLGVPVTYVSKDKEYLAVLTEIFNNNDEQEENHDLGSKGSIKGQGFELVYVDENGNTCFDCLDTESVIMVYDTSIKNIPCMALRYYTVHNYITLIDVIKIEIYTKDNIYHCTKTGDSISMDTVEPHFFGEVPIVEFPNDRYRRGDFEGIITLQDMANKNCADVSNDIEYFSNCYLGISKSEGTTKEDIKIMKEDRVMIFPEGGDAKFITKNINDTAVQNHRDNLSEDIHKMSYTPDLSKEINSNVSGEALKTKTIATSDRIINKERKFKKALQARIRLITKILNLKGYKKDGKDIKTHEYISNDIDINFHRNIPTGLFSTADSISKMSTVVSKKRLLIEVGIEDVDAEMEQIELEQNANVDLENLHVTTETPTETQTDVIVDEQ